MSVLRRRFGALPFLLCLFVGSVQLGTGETPKVPTTWWPDPSTGQMWTGQSSSQLRGAMNWNDASSYCSSLTLGGLSAWRLPTLDEMRAAEYFFPVTVTDRDGFDQTYDYLAMKGGISTTETTRIWTTTPAGDQQYVSVFMGPPDVFGLLFKPKQWGTILDPGRANAHERISKVSDRNAVLCVRSMDANLLQIAKDAEVSHPVSDLLTLKANVPLNKARQAFHAGQYQDAIAEAQKALVVKPELASAYWGIGISYGMLAQWDQATSSLESALKIDKNCSDAKTAMKWVKDSQKAAKSSKQVKDQPPQWK